VVRRDDPDALDGFDFEAADAQFFLKPSDSQDFVRRFGAKALAVRDETDARTRLEEVWEAGMESMLVQEYVPGPASSHYFIDGFVSADGRMPARLARRRLRMYPRDFGNSTYHVTVPLEEVGDALQHLTRLLSGVGFRGIFSAEFKRSGRDGELKILEVNVRPWWYVHFAATCGVNVCELAHREARGLDLEPLDDYRTGERCVLLGADIRAFLDQRREDGISLRSLLGSWRGAAGVVFSSRDPLPGLVHLKQVAARRIRRFLRASRRAPATSTS
jgi:predicted ATP-grasp superfamily ATP-dependent carboligase